MRMAHMTDVLRTNQKPWLARKNFLVGLDIIFFLLGGLKASRDVGDVKYDSARSKAPRSVVEIPLCGLSIQFCWCEMEFTSTVQTGSKLCAKGVYMLFPTHLFQSIL